MTAPIPVGLCQCGCGRTTTLAPFDDRTYGYVKGTPRDFIKGHARVLALQFGVSRNYIYHVRSRLTWKDVA